MQTTAFALPTLERLSFRPKRVPAIRVLILTPRGVGRIFSLGGPNYIFIRTFT